MNVTQRIAEATDAALLDETLGRISITKLVKHLWALGIRPHPRESDWRPLIEAAGFTIYHDPSLTVRGATYVCRGVPDFGEFERDGVVLITEANWFCQRARHGKPKFGPRKDRARIWSHTGYAFAYVRRHNLAGQCWIADTRYVRATLPAVVS